MDATRARRTKDSTRQDWYARERQRRFARFLGFGHVGPADGSRDSHLAPRPKPGA